MKVRYTSRAARQLDAILDYIAARSPQGAEAVVNRIEAALEVITKHPNAGQVTNRVGFRRIVAHPYPYVIFYRAGVGEIVIHGIRHAARRPLA